MAGKTKKTEFEEQPLFFISTEPGQDVDDENEDETEEEQEVQRILRSSKKDIKDDAQSPKAKKARKSKSLPFEISTTPQASWENGDSEKDMENPEDRELSLKKDLQKLLEESDEEETGVHAEDEKAITGEQRNLDEKSQKKERFLENFLFGRGFRSTVKTIPMKDQDNSDEEEPEETSDNDSTEKKKRKRKKKNDKAAWHDSDDENIQVKDVAATYQKAKGKHGTKDTSTQEYSEFLEKKYLSFVGTPKWAEVPGPDENQEDEDSDDEFLRNTTDMLQSGQKDSLGQGRLEYRKLNDLNHETHCEGTVIKSSEFHPFSTVAMVAGINGTVSLFQVDGRLNPKIQTVNFKDFPIMSAHFSPDGNEVIAASKKFDHFFVYDMIKGTSQQVRVTNRRKGLGSIRKFKIGKTAISVMGRFGEIHILNKNTKDISFSLKMNDPVKDVTFSPDGQEIYSYGVGGEVYLWDIRSTRSCLHRFMDEGSICGTSIAVSPDNRYLACGSDSGVVNLYNRSSALKTSNPVPEKAIMNLTTSIEHLKFNPSSDILAMASELKENAIKMLHVPSRTVYANFPSWNFNLKRVNCLDFSLNGGYFSVGNNRGAANLYRLKHFKNY